MPKAGWRTPGATAAALTRASPRRAGQELVKSAAARLTRTALGTPRAR